MRPALFQRKPSLTCQGGKGWSLHLRAREAKAGAFAYVPGRQRLEPSLTCQGGKGWSLHLRAREAKAGAFAYVPGRQRLEPSLTCQGGKGWSLRLRQPRPLNFQVPMRYEIILDVIGHRLLKAEHGAVMSRSF
jgi:hypothetical protein